MRTGRLLLLLANLALIAAWLGQFRGHARPHLVRRALRAGGRRAAAKLGQ